VNKAHLEFCSSPEWARLVEDDLLPWVLDGCELGDDLLEVGPGPGLTTDVLRRRAARLTALELDRDLAAQLAARLAGSNVTVVEGDVTRMPFPDGRFSAAACLTMLHHIPSPALQDAALAELARVLRPGGTMAITVPAWLSERICWALTDEYHAPFVEGGHVRIYSEPELREKLRATGLRPGAAHHAHALHAPYWWLKCAVGPTNDENPLVKAYHQVLLWDIGQAQPMGTVTRWLDRLANPFIGKSIVVYAAKAEG
jgi:SAM-dependent methyltransferase